MILVFPERNEKRELPVTARLLPSDGEWTVLPSHLTFLVPLSLPSGVMRRMTEDQLRTMAFDHVPLPPAAAKVWLMVPRVGFFSRGPVTAWAIVAPTSVLPADFERCIPEDLLLASMLKDKRFAKGGWVALDDAPALTVVGTGPNAKSPHVWKQLAQGTQARTTEIPLSLTSLLGRGSLLVRLEAGGPFEPLMEKYGKPATEKAAVALANAVPALIRSAHATLHPNPFEVRRAKETLSGETSRAEAAVRATLGSRFRWAAALVALVLPFASMFVSHYHHTRVSESLTGAMSAAYKKRFGAAVPDPVKALSAKVKSSPDAARATSVPLHLWLSAVDRLSGRAASASLRLDAVSLDGVRVEIRGSAADLQSVAQWVAGLASDPTLADAALVSSEGRMSDKRTVFLVRARLRLRPEGPSA